MAAMRAAKAAKAAQRGNAQPAAKEYARARGAEAAVFKISGADGQLLKRTCNSEAEAREQIAALQRLVKGGYTIVSV
jgi:hypothetical protein